MRLIGVGAFGIVDQRRGEVALLVEDHETLPFDGLDAFAGHVGAVIRVFACEDLHLVGFKRCSGISLHAADALALRQIAGETFAQQVGAYDFVVDLDHLRQVSAIIRSYNSPSDSPIARACFGTMLPALIPGIEFSSMK